MIVDIKKPFRLCLAANKENEGVMHPDAHLLCYRIRLSPGQEPFRGPAGPVFINDQFQQDGYDVNHLREPVRSLGGAVNEVD